MRRPGSSVGIAIGYGLDGPGVESRWRRDFPHLFRPTLGPIQPPVQWVPGLSRGWRAAGAWRWPLTPLLVPWSRKSRAIPLLPLWAVRPVQSLMPVPGCTLPLSLLVEWHRQRSTRREISPTVTLSSTNPTRTNLGSKPGFREARPATNRALLFLR